eukprot:10046027-Alexandrium_andersonii.AAC.1
MASLGMATASPRQYHPRAPGGPQAPRYSTRTSNQAKLSTQSRVHREIRCPALQQEWTRQAAARGLGWASVGV